MQLPETSPDEDHPMLPSAKETSELEAGLDRLRSISENIPAIVYEYIFRKDGTHGFHYISPAVEQLFGLTVAEYANMGSYLHPDDLKTILEKQDHSGKTNQPLSFEGRLLMPGREPLWQSINSTFSYQTPDGSKIFTGVIVDITEKKKTEQALHESEIRFRDLSLNVPGVIYQWYENYDGSFGFSYISPKLRDYFDIDPSEMEKVMNMIHPDDSERWRKSIDEANKSGNPWEFEGRLLYPDGNIKWWRGTSIMSAKTDKGRIYNGIMVDITQMVKTRNALEKSNERYNYAVRATSDAIWDWDIVEKKIYRGDGFTELFGHTETVISSDSIVDHVHPDDKARVLESLEKAIAENQDRWQAEYQYLCANNSYKIVLDKACMVRDDRGNLIRIIGAMRDMSEQRRLERKIVEEEKQRKSEIIQAIIEAQEKERREISSELHDNINQVLATCKLFLEMAEKNPAASASYIAKCNDNIQRVINEIRNISGNLAPYALKDLGLVAAVRDIVERINESGRLVIEFIAPKGLDEETISPDIKMAVFRIIQELLSNIIKHAEASLGKIEMGFDRGTLSLRLSDNGKGFDKEKIKKGSGLHNINNRIEYFNGSSEIESSPGKGCLLFIEIPCGEDPTTPLNQ